MRLFSTETATDDSGLSMGLAADLYIPTGDNEAYQSEGLRVEPRLVTDYRFDGGTQLGINLGWVFRDDAQLLNVEINDLLTAGVALDLPLGETVHLVPEVNSNIALLADDFDAFESPVEALLGLKWWVQKDVMLLAGGGIGIINGIGTPDWRAFAGFAWRAQPTTRICTEGPEDFDGFEDDDDCADPDNDQDGILDIGDVCPNEPEDQDGFEDDQGCPDPDNDQDGFLDGDDKCPNEAEDKDGFEDADGCPDPDNDQDGVLDVDDACPDVPEDKDGFEDSDGCPDPDNDKDGVLDANDKCPDALEDTPGPDADGCPVAPVKPVDPPKPVLVVTCDKVDLGDEKVLFDVNKARIKPASYPLLDKVTSTLNAYPDILKVRVEGHTDSQGSGRYNKSLSQRRVDAVKDYLVKQGIDAGRLTSVGMGEDKPIASNATKAGRAQNRRVEVVIVERKGCESGAKP